MCVIIVKNDQQKLDPQIALKALCLNPDGFGIQMLDTGEVHKTMDKAYAYKLMMTQRPYVAHARLTTAGKTNLENTHPVQIDEHNTLFHNGTVQVPLKWDKNKSDTRFIAETLSQTPWQSWKNILSLTNSRYAYIRKTKKKKLYVNKVGTWFKQDGVHYSKDTVIGKRNIIAVYGTLRKGHHNHYLLRNALFLGEGSTLNDYKMICKGIPFVRPEVEPEVGNRITVELYAITDEELVQVDNLEGHPHSYKREVTTILMDNGLTAEAQLYFHSTVEDNGVYYSDFNHYTGGTKSLYERPSLGSYLGKRYTPPPVSELFYEGWADDDNSNDLLWDESEGRYFDMHTHAYVDFENEKVTVDPNQHELF